MNEKALKVLEYTKITQTLVTYASSDIGKATCSSLVPSDNLEEIQVAQQNTSDAVARLYRKGSLSFGMVKDLRPSLKRLTIGSSLNIYELLAVVNLLSTTSRVRSYGHREVLPEEQDSLDSLFDQLAPLPSIAREIDRCIISEEEISDEASPGLKKVRRSMHQVRDKIQSQLSSMLQSSRTYLQDAVITMRNNRYCLPVKAEYRGQINGMIHDQSSTGSTIFVEPVAVVKLNNELRELEVEEQKEIEKVLADLSNLCAEQSAFIEQNIVLLGQLDFIFAKAALSRSYDGSEPEFNTKGFIQIKKGRHPLIAKEKVVPIDITLGDQFDLLIITGPNTGGKTVSLKTVGLFTLMGQAGLHIPAFDGSKLSIFKEVYADIGDEQSIEQSLSTFSSHMTNIAPILAKADQDSLVLFDELGAGTDPTEGAALACSILAFLHNMKVRTMATTHYSELKVYALTTPGVENACCEFDVETLRPTYRLLIGIPGKSNAFAISSKLGIPDYIIEDARKRMNTEDQTFEDLLADLEKKRIAIEKAETDAALFRSKMEAQQKNIENRENALAEKQAKILADSREKANAMLAETKSFVDETIRLVNKQAAGSELSKALELERTKLRNRMNANTQPGNPQEQKKAPAKPALDPKKLHIGDKVRVCTMNLTGTVSSLPNAKGDLYVQMGILRSLVNLKDLEFIAEATISNEGNKVGGTGKIKMRKSASISPEINLIGKTVDEGIALMDKYLDDAYLAHLEKVRVVHGRGTGALRAGIQQHLKGLKYVKSFHLGEYGEGDTGVTIVEFK